MSFCTFLPPLADSGIAYAFRNSDAVVFDIKGILPRDRVDGRL